MGAVWGHLVRMTPGFRKRVAGYRLPPPPAPTTQTFTYTESLGGFFGFFDDATTANRRTFDRTSAVWYGYLTGTDAEMFCFGGDSTPFIIEVDGGVEVTPTLASGKIPLFSGLSDVAHLVRVRADNSAGGQHVPTTGNLFSVSGIAPAVSTPWTQHYTKNPAFPGVETYLQAAALGGNYLPAYNRPNGSAGWGTSSGSLFFRAKFDDLYVFNSAPELWFSVDGGAWTKETFGTAPAVPGGSAKSWRKVTGLSGAVGSGYREIQISDSPTSGGAGMIEGVMLTGTGADLAAPGTSKTVVNLFGASQVLGAGATMGSVDINRLPRVIPAIASAQSGNSGATIAAAITAFPAWAATVKTAQKQTLMLSIGINSADDASFQGDYQSLINAALTAGFAKVVCRGLLQTSSTASKNAKIQAAVTAVGNPAVVFADVSTWSAATTDLGGLSVWMPDGAHPNDTGYDRMAQLVVRDHSALLP